MAAGVTYTPIASYTFPDNSASSYTFSSIPSTYTDLVIVGSVKMVTSGQLLCYQFNGDTTSSYSYTLLSGRPSFTPTSSINQNQGYQFIAGWDVAMSSSAFSAIKIDVLSYSNTSFYKTSIAQGFNNDKEITAVTNMWRSGNAISSINLYGTGNIASGSKFSLYGIAAA